MNPTAKTCSFFGCPNMKNNTNKKIIFHKFPYSATRCEKWAQACHMVNLVTRHSEVCSDHFEPLCYSGHAKGGKLVWNAEPTIPARKDSKTRFAADGATTSGIAYPMVEDWGAYLCRLCAQPISLQQTSVTERSGIHIFGAEGQSLALRDKINLYLPEPVELEDSLPKFVCRLCIQRLVDTADTVNSFRAADRKLRGELATKGSLKDLEAEDMRGKSAPSDHPFKCGTCEHLFSDINSLLSHELQHAQRSPSTQRKLQPPEDPDSSLPFLCPECPSRFLSRHSLMLHGSQLHGKMCSNESLVSILLDKIDVEEVLFDFDDSLHSRIAVNTYDPLFLDSGSENELNEQPCYGDEILPERIVVLKNKSINEKIPVSKLKKSKPIVNGNNIKKTYQTRSASKSNNKIVNKIASNNLTVLNNNIVNRQISESEVEIIGNDSSFVEVPDIEISYECSECDGIYKDVNVFKRHLKTHKTKEKIICTHCNKPFTVSGLKLHKQRIKDDKDYICDMCKKVFKDRHYLVMHIKNTHTNERLQCSKCPRNFKSREGLQGHLMRHEGIYSFLCDICGKSFLTHSSMRIHRRRHTQQNFFSCNVCGKKIQEHNRFQDHLRTHTGETPFGCEKCDRKFHSKKLLKQHMQTHTNLRPHKCPHCNMCFKRVGNLKQHLERHETYRPICSICRASFNTCEERNEHRRTHTTEEREEAKIARMKPKGPKRNRNQYLCKGCKTVFYSKEEKAEHIALNPDHVNSVRCETCNQTFRSYQSLSVHQRVHTGERPYTCTVCLKGFRTYATCRQHTQIHTAESKFKCDMCDRSFNRLYTLNVHKRSHSNERPFSCPTCGRGFKQKQDMKKHMRLHLVKDVTDIVPGARIHHDKWGQMVIEEDLTMQHQLNQQLVSQTLHHHQCETITIPADMQHELQYGQPNILATSNIVITVPFVHSGVPTDPQAFFSM